MAIQNRRGSYADFGDGSNLVDGEFGIVMSGDTNTDDGTGTYISNGGGIVHRLLTDDDKEELAGGISDNADNISALNTTLTNINVVTDSGNLNVVSVPGNQVWTIVGSMSLPVGEYFLVGSGAFASNGTGYRGLAISAVSNPSGMFTREMVQCAGTADTNTVLQTIRRITLTVTSTIYLVARQNSGSALNLYPRMIAVRLR